MAGVGGASYGRGLGQEVGQGDGQEEGPSRSGSGPRRSARRALEGGWQEHMQHCGGSPAFLMVSCIIHESRNMMYGPGRHLILLACMMPCRP